MKDYTAYIENVNKTNPFLRHNHMRAVRVSEEQAVVQAQMSPELRNSMGGVHAGLMFSMAEIAAGLLVRSDGSKQVTLDTTFRYLRNSTTDGVIEAEAVYIKRGRTVTMCRAYVREQGSDMNLAEGEFSFYCVAENV